MEIDKLNSLVELYFKKCEEVDLNRPFLKWLKPGKPTYSWGDIKERVFKLSSKIKSLIQEGDRCLILSENRPYWLMADLAIMNAGGISVPIFTTYSSNDYEYILNDCKPSLIIVSNNNQFKKIKKYVNLNEQKIISFEEINADSLLIKDILNDEGKFMLVEPFAEDELKDNLTPASAMMYGFSTIVCVPTSRAQEVGLCLGAQAGPKRLIKVLEDAGFEGVRISESTTNNLVFEAAK